MADTAEASGVPIKAKCRWYRPRFTLAALLVLVTVVAIPLSYMAQRRAWNLRRKAAYEELLNTGVFFSIPEREQTYWTQLRRAILFDASPVTSVGFSDKSGGSAERVVSDVHLKLLANFPEIEKVHISGAKHLSDTGLSELRRLPRLQYIVLQSAPNVKGSFLSDLRNSTALASLWFESLSGLKGESLTPLKDFPELRFLKLFRCPNLNDETLANVSLPPQLDELTIEDVGIGDATLTRWLMSNQFTRLGLNNTRITRKSAPALDNQSNLEGLVIINAPLEDADLRFLARCKKLELFFLSGMPLRGEFLRHFANTSKIVYINLSHTPLTDANAEELFRFSELGTLTLDFTSVSGNFLSKKKERWAKRFSIYLRGTEFSEQGKKLLARTCTFNKVELPINWKQSDFDCCRCTEIHYYTPKGKTWTLSADGSPQAGVSKGHAADSIISIDRCPLDLMGPVIRLHEMARREKSERSDEKE